MGIISLQLFILHLDSCWRCRHSNTCKNERLFLFYICLKQPDPAALAFIFSFEIVAFLPVVFQGGSQSCNAFFFQGQLGLLPLQILVQFVLLVDDLSVEGVGFVLQLGVLGLQGLVILFMLAYAGSLASNLST